MHTAGGFVALISFYELRTSRIIALHTMGTSRLLRAAAHARSCIPIAVSKFTQLGNLSNVWLEDLQEAESSRSLTLVRSLAVRSRWLAKDTQNEVVAELDGSEK